MEREVKEVDIELEINYDATVSNPIFFDEYQQRKDLLKVLMQKWEDLHIEIDQLNS